MKRFSNILFVADSSADDAAAFGQALQLAQDNQAKISIVGVVEAARIRKDNKVNTKELQRTIVEQRQEQLQALARSTSLDGSEVEIKVLIGKAFVEVIREVIRCRRDLLIKSVERKGTDGGNAFSSTDVKLMRKCPCPVWLIKTTQQKGYRAILLGVDYEPENAVNEKLNRQLLEMAASLALAQFTDLHVVHAWRLEHEDFLRSPRFGFSDTEVAAMVQEEENRRRQWLTTIVEQCCARLGKEIASYLKPQLHLVTGDPRSVVPKYARDLGAELVILGTVARTGIPGFIMGNTAEAILGEIDCSVLTVKPSGFVSPVTLER